MLKDIRSSLSLDEQEGIVRQAYAKLKSFLIKYDLTIAPALTDVASNSKAFLADTEAISAKQLLSNIVPACEHCNKSKGSKTFEEYLDYLKQFKDAINVSIIDRVTVVNPDKEE